MREQERPSKYTYRNTIQKAFFIRGLFKTHNLKKTGGVVQILVDSQLKNDSHAP